MSRTNGKKIKEKEKRMILYETLAKTLATELKYPEPKYSTEADYKISTAMLISEYNTKLGKQNLISMLKDNLYSSNEITLILVDFNLMNGAY